MLQLKFLTGITLLPVGGMTSSNFEGLSPVTLTFDIAWHAVAPVLCIALIQVAVFSRLLRAQMIDFLSQDYIRTARAKGLSERSVVNRHALKNALVPFVAGFGALLPALAWSKSSSTGPASPRRCSRRLISKISSCSSG